MTEGQFAEFETCYGADPNGRAKRNPNDSVENRWKSFHISEIKERGYKLDGLKWLKDESLDDVANLPEPEELATEAISELKGSIDELNEIVAMLENDNGGSE